MVPPAAGGRARYENSRPDRLTPTAARPPGRQDRPADRRTDRLTLGSNPARRTRAISLVPEYRSPEMARYCPRDDAVAIAEKRTDKPINVACRLPVPQFPDDGDGIRCVVIMDVRCVVITDVVPYEMSSCPGRGRSQGARPQPLLVAALRPGSGRDLLSRLLEGGLRNPIERSARY